MGDENLADWQQMARDARIDPAEVRLVYERFAAHQKFAAEGRGEAIALQSWFRFYHLEKSSEGQQAAPAPGGCSVDSDAVNNACISRPGKFLAVLNAYAAEVGP